MMKKFLFLLAALLLVVTSASAQYKVRLVDCPGAQLTRLFGINDNGVMVGRYLGEDGISQPMIYHDGICESLRPYFPTWIFPPDSDLGQANGINNRGDIAGSWWKIENGSITWFEDSPMVHCINLQGISESGDTVGYFNTDQDCIGPLHGFRMERDKKWSELQELVLNFTGVVDVLPSGINARGDIVGNWDPDPLIVGHAFVFPKIGAPFSFDVPQSKPLTTFGSGINNRADLVGFFTSSVDDKGHGFALLGGQWVVFEPATPYVNIQPWAINNNRVIVGNVRDANGIHGFIATPVKAE